MIELTPEAAAQVARLRHYYTDTRRPQALRNLAHSLAEASLLILNAPQQGSPSPRPYPQLAGRGELWLKRGRYWISYNPAEPVITGVYFESDDIPNRVG